MLYRLNLILNTNLGLALFRQNQILLSTRHRNLQNHNNEVFFIQLLNAWLHFTDNTFPTPTLIEEILDQPLFLNPHTKLDFNSDNPYFYCILPRNISDKFATVRGICRFLQPGFISPITFEGKLSLPSTNHNNISIIELIPKDWIHLLRTKTSQQSFLWTNHIEGNPVLSPTTSGKIFSNWFKKSSDGYIFSIWYKLVHFSLPLSPALHRMGNTPTNLCPRCKEREECHSHFIFHSKLSQNTLNFINEIINHNNDFQSPFKIGIKDILIGTSCHTHDGVKLSQFFQHL